MQITRKKDKRTVSAFTHKLADIPSGVTVSVASLGGSILREGTPIAKGGDSGLNQVVKVAALSEATTEDAAVYSVAKGHHFKVGDVVMLETGAKASAIVSIAPNTDKVSDDITVTATLGNAEAGACLYQAKVASTTTTSAFKYKAYALVGESYDVIGGDNLMINVVTIGQIREANIPAIGEVKSQVSGITFI